MSEVVIGLEVHVQLSTGKLFCRCPVEPSGPDHGEIRRKLKPTSGESGNIDRAALYEEERSRSFVYNCPDNTCLVEYDEEPPREVDPKALTTSVDIAGSLHCKLLKKIECMRKIVIDGSNTSGFQRTMFFASDGYVDTSRGRVRISSVCLEEDSARKIESEGEEVLYSLGRQGIPLVEIATEPDIIDPDHAIETARIIGLHAILTGNTRHDADAIRQDVNMSMGHGRVEIKGVSRLSHIKEALLAEISRQKMLEKVSETVSKRGGFDPETLEFRDITEVMSHTDSKMINRSLKSGSSVFGSILKNLSGVLKTGDLRLGQEMGDLAKAFSVGGVIHSDELPGYGIDQKLKDGLSKKFGCSTDDAFLVIICSEPKMKVLQPELAERLRKVLDLELSETRYFMDVGRTAYLRPMPGASRMYPETDIQPIVIEDGDLSHAKKLGKSTIEERVDTISTRYGISRQDTMTLVTGIHLEPFMEMSRSISPRLAARLILQRIPELERKHETTADISSIISLIHSVKEKALPDVSVEYAVDLLLAGESPGHILDSRTLSPMTTDELNSFVAGLRKKDSNLNPGKIMSIARSELKRPFDPKDLAEILKIQNHRKKDI